MNAIVLTGSSIKRMQLCERLYYYSDVLGLERIREEVSTEPLWIGREWGKIQETGKLPGFDGRPPEQKILVAKLHGMFLAWCEFHGGIPQGLVPERIYYRELKHPRGRQTGYIIGGKVDAISALSPEFWEYKTTQTIDRAYIEKLDCDLQILIYSWLTGYETVHYDVIRVPKLAFSEEKGLDEYCTRVQEALLKDTFKSFYRTTLSIPAAQIAFIVGYLRACCKKIRGIRATGGDLNINACWGQWGRSCRYLDICTSLDPDFIRQSEFGEHPENINRELRSEVANATTDSQNPDGD